MSFNCCYKCTRRYVGCHSKCPDYAKESKKNAERKVREHAMVNTPYSAKTYRKVKRSEGRRK